MIKQIVVFFAFLMGYGCFAQESLTLNACKEHFQKRNLLLLAEQYNLSAAKAAVIQAKMWAQPYLSAEVNAINPEDNKLFDAGSQGQKTLAVQQLIYLGGKKKKEVDFARSNVAIAEIQFAQLLRSLNYQLEQNFYSIFYDQQKTNNIDLQSIELDTLLSDFTSQAGKGDIELKDVVRLQALVLTLKNDKINFQKDIYLQLQELQLLTGLHEVITPVANDHATILNFSKAKILQDSLLAVALINNPDYLLAEKFAQSQALNLRWQQSLAVPDISTGLSYDQRGGAFDNQVNLTIGIPLRLWNGNKGNIKIAEAQLNQSTIRKEYSKQQLQSSVDAAWLTWQNQQGQMAAITDSVVNNLSSVYKIVLSDFKKRKISLLDFTDFMESYHQTYTQFTEIKKQLVLAGLRLNYIVTATVL